MKELAKVVIITGLLIGAAAAAIHGFGDRELFVPPPDAVAEGFMREVTMKRFDQASSYLADSGSTHFDLPGLARNIERTHGYVDDINARTITSTKGRAVVRVQLRSALRTDSMAVTTVWEGHGWKVDSFR